MAKKTLPHVPMNQFKTQAGELLIGGIPLTQLAARVGQTPFYAYDRQLIEQRIEVFRQQMPENLDLHYAIKANPMPALVDFIAPQVDGLDVASLKELRIALDSGMSADNISMAGPGKNLTELEAAVASGITINCESTTELTRLAAISEKLGISAKVALRINPDFSLKASGMKMGGGPQQFGIDSEQAPAALKRLSELGLKFIGFHIFSGSQNLKEEALIETQNQTLDLALKLAENAPELPSVINIGGGFGVPYFPGEKRLNLSQIGDNLQQRLQQLSMRYPQLKVVTELGRFLVAEAGVYVCQITDIKISRGHKFLITNGGLHHHLAASGNFGQILRKNYPVTIGNRMNQNNSERVSVVGPLCTPLDLLADKMELPCAEIDDLVVIFQSGAYGLTASPGNFLSHPQAIEVLV